MDKYQSLLNQEIHFLTYADLPDWHPAVQASYQRIIDARTKFVGKDDSVVVDLPQSTKQLVN